MEKRKAKPCFNLTIQYRLYQHSQKMQKGATKELRWGKCSVSCWLGYTLTFLVPYMPFWFRVQTSMTIASHLQIWKTQNTWLPNMLTVRLKEDQIVTMLVFGTPLCFANCVVNFLQYGRSMLDSKIFTDIYSIFFNTFLQWAISSLGLYRYSFSKRLNSLYYIFHFLRMHQSELSEGIHYLCRPSQGHCFNFQSRQVPNSQN